MQSRPARLGDQVRAELSALLQRSVRDPAVQLVTVTHVRMTKDLQHARVYYTTLGDTENARRETSRGLRRATPFLRSQLGRRIRVRHVPDLTFVYDESIEREQRIAQVLEELRDDAPPTPRDIQDDSSTR
ncbi:MAG: 30S ribosome-binding factor RbfA [Vicinamibacterales bacterium]|jgi:ribosome-binding factor A|nr:30S ribosome-binding factor RbfA [Vicinamibacterales bacterium]